MTPSLTKQIPLEEVGPYLSRGEKVVARLGEKEFPVAMDQGHPRVMMESPWMNLPAPFAEHLGSQFFADVTEEGKVQGEFRCVECGAVRWTYTYSAPESKQEEVMPHNLSEHEPGQDATAPVVTAPGEISTRLHNLAKWCEDEIQTASHGDYGRGYADALESVGEALRSILGTLESSDVRPTCVHESPPHRGLPAKGIIPPSPEQP